MFRDAQNAVLKFHERFGLPISVRPVLLDKHRTELRAEWLRGEVDEFVQARDIVEQVDATVDLIYFAIGALVEMGVDGSSVFEIIHSANMRKLGKDGKPISDSSGRILKPENWVSPNDEIRDSLMRPA